MGREWRVGHDGAIEALHRGNSQPTDRPRLTSLNHSFTLDCNIYVCSRRAGERVMASITRFITTKLKLKVNEQKSAVARPWERKFLGFSFTANREPKRRIAPKAVLRFKEKVRELTGRTRGVSTARMAEELARYLRGWLGYFGKCETPFVLEELERWFRRRL